MNSVEEICKRAQRASYALASASAEAKNQMLEAIARALELCTEDILRANRADMERAADLTDAMRDRLLLTPERIAAMAQGVREVAQLRDPVGEVVEEFDRPNGLRIRKVRVPLGVIGVIYEARPNVTIDVAALCVKSGNCVVLRGGKEAVNSNRALARTVSRALEENGCDPAVVSFIDDVTRESSQELLRQGKYVDVMIPRGGDGLKKFVLEHATMPVIASSGGNCHTYVEQTADLKMAESIVYNAKMSRPSVCNATEQLLVDRAIAREFLPVIVGKLTSGGCKVNGCEETRAIVPQVAPADEESYRTEYHDYELTVRVVSGVEEAIDRINANGSKHSEAIVTQDRAKADEFTAKVDAACVYVNASTRFTDGFEFGFGAEIAISTQKIHARGPLGLQQLTGEKYIVEGSGQVRE